MNGGRVADVTQPSVIGIMPDHRLAPAQRRELIGPCESVFAEDLPPLFESLGDPVHRLAWDRSAHACWVERWLNVEGLPLLRTASVKAVAVAPERQGRGGGPSRCAVSPR